ncbi:MAG: Gfo/Idh/MocA family oxidoreductase [Anaerolineae bacterium]|nr:Gfo/Idh/MocA family oxidoreductase [Anaerolineae bacterium]
MADYKLVFVGASGHVGEVLNELAHFPQVHFVGYAPSFPGEDVSTFARFGAKPYEDWREMLTSEEPDIVAICARYDLNNVVGIEAARRGCHIISDKPAAQTIEGLNELRQLVKEKGLLYASMLVMRYWPTFYTARQLVQEGVIGEPYLISAQKSYRWGVRPEWYADRAKYGSTMTWVGIHAFDFARWVAGVDYAEVFAYHANLVHKERPGCQDVATVIARLANGGSAIFNLDYLRPEAAPTHGDDRLRIAGSRGVLEVCDHGTRLHVITAEKDVPSWPLQDPGRSLFGDLVAALEGKGELLVPAEEAFEVTSFAIEAAEAADTGRVIRLL